MNKEYDKPSKDSVAFGEIVSEYIKSFIEELKELKKDDKSEKI